MDITHLISASQDGDKEAMSTLVNMFEPLFKKHSYFNGKYNSDIHQELTIKFVEAVNRFQA